MILNSFDGSLRLTPFPHACITEAFSPVASIDMLCWLEESAPWKLKIADFYEQYEFCFEDAKLPPDIAPLFSLQSLSSLRKKIELAFQVRLKDEIDIVAHKLIAGQRIRIHNDFISGQETHRVLIQLNRGWTQENGGMLLIFGSKNIQDVRHVYLPIHNTSVAFEISPQSFHAVSPVVSGERFTLVFSFFRDIS